MELALIETISIDRRQAASGAGGIFANRDSRIQFKPENYVYHFCGIPFTSRTHLEGHAVARDVRLLRSYRLLPGDRQPDVLETLNTLWEGSIFGADVCHRRVRCAQAMARRLAILMNAERTRIRESLRGDRNMMWNWRNAAAPVRRSKADVIERALYKRDQFGDVAKWHAYCYRNPLAFILRRERFATSGMTRRAARRTLNAL